jgi:hypothetical protein
MTVHSGGNPDVDRGSARFDHTVDNTSFGREVEFGN